MTSTQLDVSIRSRERATRVFPAAAYELRRLWSIRPSLFPLFTVLSAAVAASPLLLDSTLESDWRRFWQFTWLGFDAAMTGALVIAAVGAFRRSPWSEGSAAVAASLLACNAVVDVTTAADTRHIVLAGITAVTLEVPLMALCLMIACPKEPAALSAPVGGSSS
jgi:peptidoglycan/LPS O-acetylase OafA/YrhL